MNILYPYQLEPSKQLIRALERGNETWGYPGAADLSDVGVGKSFIDLNAALSTGRKVVVLTPIAGFNNWCKTFRMFNADPHYIGTPDGLRQGHKTHIVTRQGDTFRWKKPEEITLIVDEAHQCGGIDSLNSFLIDGAIAQGIPMICSSATLASSPLNLRVAGQITGLHDGTEAGWLQFLDANGCRWNEEEERWLWNRKQHILEQIHHTLIPQRGCRVRKSDMGERPSQTIDVLPIQCAEGPRIEQEWKRALSQLADMGKKRYPPHVLIGIRRKVRMRLWQQCEQVLLPHVADLMRRDLNDGKSVLGFFSFTESREAMGRLLNTRDGFYGGQKAFERAQIEGAFQADRIRVLLSQVKAGGSSVSLHDLHGSHPRVTYLFPSDSAVAMGQVPGRTDRMGMITASQVWIPCVAGSLSEAMVRSTARKLMAVDALNDGSHRGNAKAVAGAASPSADG